MTGSEAKTLEHAKAINEETHVNRGIGQRGIFETQSAAATLNRSAKAEPFEGIPNMIRELIADATGEFQQNSLQTVNTDGTKKTRAPEPPAEHRGLIGPREIAQMADRKRQIAALRKMIADREGRSDGR